MSYQNNIPTGIPDEHDDPTTGMNIHIPIDLTSTSSESEENVVSDNDSAFFSITSSDCETISLAESIRSYVYENGRTYHSYQQGKYALPNDPEEQERLDYFHHLFLIWLEGRLYSAPIANPTRVLDLGTGTGVWAMEMAEQNPQCSIIGNDLSPIQPSFVWSNLRFEVDDIELEWVHPENHFDLIHVRCLSGFIRDWDFLFEQAYKCLEPGGWIDFSDASNDLHYVNPPPVETANQRWYNKVVEASALAGRPMKIVYLVEDYLKRAGFVDISIEMTDWPYGPWMKERKQKEIGRFVIHLAISSLSCYAMALLTRHLKWSKEEVDELCAEAEHEIQTNKYGNMHSRMCFAHARKPFPHEIV